ncbi:MAG: hypothetical protein SGBAC_009193 [Bacillariaceae sp.]
MEEASCKDTHQLVTNEQEPLKGIPRHISRLTIDPSVQVICQCAFQNSRSLIEVKFHNHIQAIGEKSFLYCVSLTEIQVPSSVEVIGKEAFKFCDSLREVGLSEGLKSIGARAFEECTKLLIRSLPSSVETIGGSAFLGCRSIIDFELRSEQLTTLGDNVFKNCYKLKRMSILSPLLPNTTKGIFCGCYSLVGVALTNGLQEIGASTFEHCKSLKKISLPSSVKIIRTKSFWSCEYLSEVDLKEGLECIERLAFGYCELLATISLPSSVQVISDLAFANCKRLMGVEFGSDMKTRLEGQPFSQCAALKTVSLPLECEPADFAGSLGLRAPVKSEKPDEYHNRFANLPIHEACYHASHTTVEELEAQLNSFTIEGKLEDFFGMTPFHIVATAGKVRLDLLEVLLRRYPLSTLTQRDRGWKTMMEYTMQHRNPKGNALKACLLEWIVNDAMAGWGLERWKLDVLPLLGKVAWAASASLPEGMTQNRTRLIKARHHAVDVIQDTIAGYLKVELTSILELGLWKKQEMEWLNENDGEIGTVQRGECRTTCGADAVIPHVSKFLWDAKNTISGSFISPILQCDIDWAKKMHEKK